MNAKLLTEHHLEFLSLKEGCIGSSESTLVKMPHDCWKSNFAAHFMFLSSLSSHTHGTCILSINLYLVSVSKPYLVLPSVNLSAANYRESIATKNKVFFPIEH